MRTKVLGAGAGGIPAVSYLLSLPALRAQDRDLLPGPPPACKAPNEQGTAFDACRSIHTPLLAKPLFKLSGGACLPGLPGW
jgi:hypothetical protein